MKTSLCILAALLLVFPDVLRAQDQSVPQIVVQGFQDFGKNGALSAVNTWLTGSARESDDNTMDAATGRMNRVQGLFGRFLGHELVRVVPLSPSTRRIYCAMKFEKGVAWILFDCCKPQGEWIVSSFDFYTRANLILPPNILGGQ